MHEAARYGCFPVVKLLVEMGAEVEVRHFLTGWTPRAISEQEGHVTVPSWLAVVEVAGATAREGNVEHFKQVVKVGVLPAPLRQWVPLLPLSARASLSLWVDASIAD